MSFLFRSFSPFKGCITRTLGFLRGLLKSPKPIKLGKNVKSPLKYLLLLRHLSYLFFSVLVSHLSRPDYHAKADLQADYNLLVKLNLLPFSPHRFIGYL